MSAPLRAEARLIVKAVVERAETSATAVVLLSVMNTSGVTLYGVPKVIVHELADVPVVTSPVTSLEPAVKTGLPEPQELTEGV